MSPEIKVRFIWFFDNNGIQTTFFCGYLESLGYSVSLIKNENEFCDIEFVGVFRPRKELLKSKIKRILAKNTPVGTDSGFNYPNIYPTTSKNSRYRVWLTTENVRPPVQEDFDLVLSFDQTSFGISHIYFPTWLMQIGLFGPAKLEHLGVEASIVDLVKPRKMNDTQLEKKFCCAIFANPHNVRLNAIKWLHPSIDVFGPYVSRPVKSKHAVASAYRFMLCFENDLYPGYVTEKLIEAYVSGTVPLYWGDLGSDSMINRKCFINLKDFDSMASFADYIYAMDAEDYRQIYEQPFLSDLNNVQSVFQKFSLNKVFSTPNSVRSD